MASKKIDIKFDLDSKSVKIAGEETMRLAQKVKILKNELATGNYSQEEFDALANTLDNLQDGMEGAKARSGDLLTSLQLIPGPVGDIAAKVNGAVSVLRQFAGFSFKDLQAQFARTLADIKEIAVSIMRNTGITKVYETVNKALAASFVAVGVGEQAAAVGARAFAAALTATGVGAIVVALGFAVSALMEYVTATDEGTTANEQFEASLASVDSALAKSTADRRRLTAERIAQSKNLGEEESKQREISLEKLKGDLADTNKAYTQALAIEEEQRILNTENLAKAQQKREELEQKKKDLISEIKVFELDSDTALNKEREAQRQKNAQAQERANAAALKAAQDHQRLMDEAAAINREAELSLLDAYDREVAERLERFTKEENKLREAGFKEGSEEMKRLRQEFNLDMDAIDTKYRNERLEREQGIQNELNQLRASQTQTLLDDAQVEIDIATQKYDKLIQLAIQNGDDVAAIVKLKEEQLANIRKTAEEKETERKKNEDLKKLEAERTYQQQRLNMMYQSLDGIISIAGEESKVGRMALIAKQVLMAKELVLEIKRTIAFSKQALIRSQVDVASGAASTLKVGLPAALPLLALYAVQAASIISSVIKATRAASDSQGGGGGMDGGAPPAPNLPTPQPYQVIARRNQGGFVFGGGGSITDSIPAMLSNGEFVMNARSAEMFSPILTAMNNIGKMPNTSLPKSLESQSLVDVMSQGMNNRPIKTYVTAQDMSNQQQFDRTIKSRSLI